MPAVAPVHIEIRFPALPLETFHVEVPVRAVAASDLSIAGHWDDRKAPPRTYWEHGGSLWRHGEKGTISEHRKLVERLVSYGRYLRENIPERARSGGIDDVPEGLRAKARAMAAGRAKMLLAVDDELYDRTYGPVLAAHWVKQGRASLKLIDLDDPQRELSQYDLLTDALDYESARWRLRTCFPRIGIPQERWTATTPSPTRSALAGYVAERQIWRFLSRRRELTGMDRGAVETIHRLRAFLEGRHPHLRVDWSSSAPDLDGGVYGGEPADAAVLLPLLRLVVEMDARLPDDFGVPYARMALMELEASIGADGAELEYLQF